MHFRSYSLQMLFFREGETFQVDCSSQFFKLPLSHSSLHETCNSPSDFRTFSVSFGLWQLVTRIMFLFQTLSSWCFPAIADAWSSWESVLGCNSSSSSVADGGASCQSVWNSEVWDLNLPFWWTSELFSKSFFVMWWFFLRCFIFSDE